MHAGGDLGTTHGPHGEAQGHAADDQPRQATLGPSVNVDTGQANGRQQHHEAGELGLVLGHLEAGGQQRDHHHGPTQACEPRDHARQEAAGQAPFPDAIRAEGLDAPVHGHDLFAQEGLDREEDQEGRVAPAQDRVGNEVGHQGAPGDAEEEGQYENPHQGQAGADAPPVVVEHGGQTRGQEHGRQGGALGLVLVQSQHRAQQGHHDDAAADAEEPGQDPAAEARAQTRQQMIGFQEQGASELTGTGTTRRPKSHSRILGSPVVQWKVGGHCAGPAQRGCGTRQSAGRVAAPTQDAGAIGPVLRPGRRAPPPPGPHARHASDGDLGAGLQPH